MIKYNFAGEVMLTPDSELYLLCTLAGEKCLDDYRERIGVPYSAYTLVRLKNLVSLRDSDLLHHKGFSVQLDVKEDVDLDNSPIWLQSESGWVAIKRERVQHTVKMCEGIVTLSMWIDWIHRDSMDSWEINKLGVNCID